MNFRIGFKLANFLLNEKHMQNNVAFIIIHLNKPSCFNARLICYYLEDVTIY